MNIAVRLEGGLGDHLLGNRFIHAIKDKYPNSNLHVFSDTENNPNSINVLKALFPNIYNNTTVVGQRKDKNYKINSMFGEEPYPAHIDNLPDDTLQAIKNCDIFYDLHIDGLKWLNYDFDWLRYYYFFPRPQIELKQKYNEKYIMAHLYSRPDSPYNLDQTYVIDLLTKLSEIKDHKIVVVTMEQYKEYYQDLFNNPNIIIDTSDNVFEIFQIAAGCSAFIGIDSGVRYIPYHFSKPTFVFSKYCDRYGSVAPSHLIRWLIFEKNVFPIGFDTNLVTDVLSNCIKNPASQIFPQYTNGVEMVVVDRKL
jgi:hypothetical protein